MMNKNRKNIFLLIFLPFSFIGLWASNGDGVVNESLFLTKDCLIQKSNLLLRTKENSFTSILASEKPNSWFEECNDYNNFFNDYLSKAPEIYKPEEMMFILDKAKNLSFCHVKKENAFPIISRVMKKNEKIKSIGDLHGGSLSAYYALKSIENDPDSSVVFLGDFLDRGYNCVDTLVYVLHHCLMYEKLGQPFKIVPIRGDHENKEHNERSHDGGCSLELNSRYGKETADKIFSKLYNFFDRMPVAYYVKDDQQKKVLLFSHALVHVEDTILFDTVQEYGLDPIEKWNLEDGESQIRMDLKNTIEKNNKEDLESLLSESSTNGFSKKYVGVLNGNVKECGYTIGKINQDADSPSNEVSNMSTGQVFDWFNLNFPNQKILTFGGHNHKTIGYSIMKNFDMNGYKLYNPTDDISIYTLGPSPQGNMYELPYIQFPFGNAMGSSIYPGIIRQYSLVYNSNLQSNVKKELIYEEKDSHFSHIHLFFKNKINHENLYKEIQKSEKFLTCVDLVKNFLISESIENFIENHKDILDYDVLKSKFDLLKKQKISDDFNKPISYANNKNISTKYFFIIIKDVMHVVRTEDNDSRFSKLKDLSLHVNKNIKQILDEKFRNKIGDLFGKLFSDIDNIFYFLKNQYNILEWHAEYNESWSDFCKNTLKLKKEELLPMSLSFTDGFATYSEQEKTSLLGLLYNENFQQLVNRENYSDDHNKEYIDKLITNFFASQDLSGLYWNHDAFEWMKESAKQNVVNNLVNFLHTNEYLSINSKSIVLSNIALFLDKNEQFPIDFATIKGILEEQLIQLCDIGFAIETPIENFDQIFAVLSAVLSLDQSTELLNYLLLIPINNKKKQSEICMKSAIGIIAHFVKIEEILPVLLKYSELDLEIFEKFCLNGFLNNPGAFLDFFDRFLLDDQLHSCFKKLTKENFIIDFLNKDTGKLKSALDKIKKDEEFENKKAAILEAIKNNVHRNASLVEFFIEHALSEDVFSMFQKFCKDMSNEKKDIEKKIKIKKNENKNFSDDDIATNVYPKKLAKKIEIVDSIKKCESRRDQISNSIVSSYNALKKHKPADLCLIFDFMGNPQYSNLFPVWDDIFISYVNCLIAIAQEKLREPDAIDVVALQYIKENGLSKDPSKNESNKTFVLNTLNNINDRFVSDFVVMNFHAYPELFDEYNDLLEGVSVENFIRFLNNVSDCSIKYYFQKNEKNIINFFCENKATKDKKNDEDQYEEYQRSYNVIEKFIMRLLIAKDNSLQCFLKVFLSNEQIKEIFDKDSLFEVFKNHLGSFSYWDKKSKAFFLNRIIDCFDFDNNLEIQDFVKKQINKIDPEIFSEPFDFTPNIVQLILEKITKGEKIVGEEIVVRSIMDDKDKQNFVERLCEVSDKIRCLVLEKFLFGCRSKFQYDFLLKQFFENVIKIDPEHNLKPIQEMINSIVTRRNSSFYDQSFSVLFEKLSMFPTFFSDTFFPIESWKDIDQRKLILSNKEIFLLLCDIFYKRWVDVFRLNNVKPELLQSIFSSDEFVEYIWNSKSFNIKQIMSLTGIFFENNIKDLIGFQDDIILKVIRGFGGLDIEEIFIPKKAYEEQNKRTLCQYGYKNGLRLWSLYDAIFDSLISDKWFNDKDCSLLVVQSLLILPRAAITLKRYASGDECSAVFKTIADTAALHIKQLSESDLDIIVKKDLFSSFRTAFNDKYNLTDELSLIIHESFFQIIQAVESHLNGDKKNQLHEEYLRVSSLVPMGKLAETLLNGEKVDDNYKKNIEKVDYHKDLEKKLLIKGGIRLKDKNKSIEIIIDSKPEEENDLKTQNNEGDDQDHSGLRFSKKQFFLTFGGLATIAAIWWFKPYKHPLAIQIKNYASWRFGFSNG